MTVEKMERGRGRTLTRRRHADLKQRWIQHVNTFAAAVAVHHLPAGPTQRQHPGDSRSHADPYPKASTQIAGICLDSDHWRAAATTETPPVRPT
jgi:hypothetical protein